MSRHPRKTVMIAAGGTGGHVFPALAVANVMRNRGYRILWLGSEKGLERDITKKEHIEMFPLNISGLSGQRILRWGLAPFMIGQAVIKAIKIFRKEKPCLVLGMGGYAAAPAGLAAILLRIPLIVHEQNAVPGMTNRLLAPFARKVLEGFSGAFPDKYHAVFTGNPLREGFESVRESEASESHPFRILVLGGSQGAQFLNAVVPSALTFIDDAGTIEVQHQTGQAKYEDTKERYDSIKHISTQVRPFIDNMPEAYDWCDLVIARAGAMTISELIHVGKPALLIPYPYAKDGHQIRNAHYIVERGAGILFEQAELTPLHLAKTLKELCNDQSKYNALCEAAKSFDLVNSTEVVAEHCMEVCHA